MQTNKKKIISRDAPVHNSQRKEADKSLEFILETLLHVFRFISNVQQQPIFRKHEKICSKHFPLCLYYYMFSLFVQKFFSSLLSRNKIFRVYKHILYGLVVPQSARL